MKKRNLASAFKGVVDDHYIDCLVATTNKWNKISVIRNSSILSYLDWATETIILLGDDITTTDLDVAGTLLETFYKDFASLYGK